MDEMGSVCSRHGQKRHTLFWWESQKERDHEENLHVAEMIIVKRIL
jgi:hypothetical protein